MTLVCDVMMGGGCSVSFGQQKRGRTSRSHSASSSWHGSCGTPFHPVRSLRSPYDHSVICHRGIPVTVARQKISFANVHSRLLLNPIVACGRFSRWGPNQLVWEGSTIAHQLSDRTWHFLVSHGPIPVCILLSMARKLIGTSPSWAGMYDQTSPFLWSSPP